MRLLFIISLPVIIFGLVVLVSVLFEHQDQIENWKPYRECPFGNIEMAPHSPVFFPIVRYRKPYQYPRKFPSSYPMNHWRHYEQKY